MHNFSGHQAMPVVAVKASAEGLRNLTETMEAEVLGRNVEGVRGMMGALGEKLRNCAMF